MQVLREVMIDTTPNPNKARGKGSKLFAKLKHEVESFLGGQKMQTVAVELMFELCRVCRLGKVDLGMYKFLVWEKKRKRLCDWYIHKKNRYRSSIHP